MSYPLGPIQCLSPPVGFCYRVQEQLDVSFTWKNRGDENSESNSHSNDIIKYKCYTVKYLNEF